MNHTEIVQKLAARRKEQGLVQVDLAQKLGVTQPVISEFESGRTSPKLETVVKYADALGMTVELKEKETEDERED